MKKYNWLLKQMSKIPIVHCFFMKEGLFYSGKNPNFKYRLVKKRFTNGYFEVYDDEEKSLDIYLNTSLFHFN